jgi:PAS domain S-box-containing protein
MQGLERFAEQRGPQLQNIIFIIAFFLLHAYFVLIYPSLEARNILFSLGLLIICLQCAWLLLHRVNAKLLPITLNLGLIFVSYCLVSIARIYLVLAIPSDKDFFHSNAYNTLLVMISQMLFIALTFGLFLMVNHSLIAELHHSVGERERREDELHKSETLFRQMFTEHSAVKMLIDPANGNIVDVNPAASQFYGYPIEALIRMNVGQINNMPSDQLECALQDALQHRQKDFIFQHRLSTGELRDVEVHSAPIQVDSRKLLYSIIHDVTERKRLDAALKASQLLAEQLYEFTPDALLTVNREGLITRVNAQAEALFGYTRDELLDQSIGKLIPQSLRTVHKQHQDHYFLEPHLRPMGSGLELLGVKNDGSEFPVEIGLSPLQINGETFVTADIRDISDRRRMEKALQQRTNVLAALHQTTLDLVNLHEMDDILQILLMKIGGLLDASDISFDLLEDPDTLVTYAVTPDQPLQRGDTMRHGEGGWLSWQAIESGQPAVLEDYATWQNRRELYEGYPIHAIAIIPVHQRDRVIGAINVSRREANKPFNDTDLYAAKQLAQMVALILDNAQLYTQLQSQLAERKRIEETLRESRENFHRYFNMSTVGMCVTAPNRRWIETNAHLRKMLGYTAEEFDQLTWNDLTHPDDLNADLGLFNQVLANKRDSYELDKRFICKNGEVLYTSMYATCYRNTDGTVRYLLASLVDITERKKAEHALLKLTAREERQRLARDLHDSVNQSIHSLVLFSETLFSTLEKNNIDRARQIAGRLQESARQALKETRLLLYEIQSSGSERKINLIQDLETRLATVERRAGVKAQIIQEGSLEYCPQAWSENLFWISIEAMNNALKHSQSRSMKIIIRCSPQHVELEVVDDGIGFDPERVRMGGMGMRNMRERANLLHGNLEIYSMPGRGSRVRFIAEIKEEHGKN